MGQYQTGPPRVKRTIRPPHPTAAPALRVTRRAASAPRVTERFPGRFEQAVGGGGAGGAGRRGAGGRAGEGAGRHPLPGTRARFAGTRLPDDHLAMAGYHGDAFQEIPRLPVRRTETGRRSAHSTSTTTR